MAIESGYYNSLNGDRKYNAETMSKYFNGLFTRGVLQNYQGKFVVEENEGMTVIVSSGKAYFSDGKWIENTTDLLVNIEAADVVLNRIDRIVLRNDRTKEGRKATVEVKKGTPSGSPTAPELTNNEDIEELSLATISVAAKQSEIKQINITNTIPDTDVCGYVTGIIEQVDTSDLYKQYQDAYKEFYDDNDERFNDLYTGNESRFDDMYTENGKKLDDQLEENDDTFNNWFSGIKNDIAEQLPLKQYRNTVTTTTDEQKVIPIGIAEYQPETDILEVFINGMRLNASEYTSDGSNVTLTNGLDSGQPVELVATKYIVNGDDPATLAGQITELQTGVKNAANKNSKNSMAAISLVALKWGDWNTTGEKYLIIKLPKAARNIISFDIQIAMHTYMQAVYHIEGAIGISSGWQTPSCYANGCTQNEETRGSIHDLPVRFGLDSDGRSCVIIGNGSQSMYNVGLSIRNLMVYGTQREGVDVLDGYRDDWIINCYDDYSDISIQGTIEHPAESYYYKISNETIEAFKKLGFVPSEGGQ